MYYDTTGTTDYQAQITITRSTDDFTSTASNFISEIKVRVREIGDSIGRLLDPFDRVRSLWEDFDRQEVRRQQELMSWRARARELAGSRERAVDPSRAPARVRRRAEHDPPAPRARARPRLVRAEDEARRPQARPDPRAPQAARVGARCIAGARSC